MQNQTNLSDRLNKALNAVPSAQIQADGDPAKTLPHPAADTILQAARNTLSQSATGQDLLDFAAITGVTIQVVRAAKRFASQPDPKAVFWGIPAHITTPTPEMVLELVGALREAHQDTDPDWKRPTVAVGKDKFVKIMVDKKKDAIFLICVVAHELGENTGEADFLDAARNMGYSDVIEAYKKDLEK